MAATPTYISRVSMKRAPRISRDIEVKSRASLFELAEAIVQAFHFDFDHAFGFYSGKTYRIFRSN
jgi:hypothetical protein